MTWMPRPIYDINYHPSCPDIHIWMAYSLEKFAKLDRNVMNIPLRAFMGNEFIRKPMDIDRNKLPI